MVKIGKLKLKNPVMVASGTFGYGIECKNLINLDKLGAIITKTITLNPRDGNPQPRIFELPYGMMNSIGLQNVGLKRFLAEKLPELKRITGTPIIVSIAGEKISEYVNIADILNKERISGIEMNISCPNVKGKIISKSKTDTYNVVKTVRKKTKQTLIVKLSPDVTDISMIAKSAALAGADAVSLINTVPAMIFPESLSASRRTSITKSPVFGGLSGPFIKHIALRKVYEVSKSVKIPVIGIGGIMNVKDVSDFLRAGAKAVEIGTGNFIDPRIPINIIKGLRP
ncbi:MAG: dihydroorotate dehydrogenase [Elusimicrobia bacterium]|nr:dihydroorotate dehydrogenase [Elusimicrobiota bacterium]